MSDDPKTLSTEEVLKRLLARADPKYGYAIATEADRQAEDERRADAERHRKKLAYKKDYESRRSVWERKKRDRTRDLHHDDLNDAHRDREPDFVTHPLYHHGHLEVGCRWIIKRRNAD